jgi:rhodanese-related sulfurtransferase
MAETLNDMVVAAKQEVGAVSVADAAGQTESVLVIDVRESSEFRAAHLPGAVHIARGLLELKADPDCPAFDPMLQDRSQPIVLYCTGGTNARSAMAAQTLKRMGFENVAWIQGGLTAWTEAGNPVES